MPDAQSANSEQAHVFKHTWVGDPMRWRTDCLCGWWDIVHSTALSHVEAKHLETTMEWDGREFKRVR